MELEQDTINAKKDEKLFEIGQLKERSRLIFDELSAFRQHIDGISRVLAADRVAREEALSGEDFSLNAPAIQEGIAGGLSTQAGARIRERLTAAGVETDQDFADLDVNTLRSILTDIRADQTQSEVGSEITSILDRLDPTEQVRLDLRI